MKRVIAIATIFFMTIAPMMAQSINAEKSVVEFKISNMKVNTVKGSFHGMKGMVNFNPHSPNASNFDVCIDASTVNTGIKKRDEHLLKEDFFDVENYPSICFKSTQITQSEEWYIVQGKLTMHGVTREVKIPFKFSGNEFKGTLNINRLDYKLGEGTGTFMVANEAEITITCIVNDKISHL